MFLLFVFFRRVLFTTLPIECRIVEDLKANCKNFDSIFAHLEIALILDRAYDFHNCQIVYVNVNKTSLFCFSLSFILILRSIFRFVYANKNWLQDVSQPDPLCLCHLKCLAISISHYIVFD